MMRSDHSASLATTTRRTSNATRNGPRQINLYMAELLKATKTANAQREEPVEIWGAYWVCLTKGERLHVLNHNRRDHSMGHMNLSRRSQTVYFSKLLTDKSYRGQGIGSLLVLLGVLYALHTGATRVALGEQDTSGGHFWTQLSLSESSMPISHVLQSIFRTQEERARTLNLSVDPNAIQVPLQPAFTAPPASSHTRRRSYG